MTAACQVLLWIESHREQVFTMKYPVGYNCTPLLHCLVLLCTFHAIVNDYQFLD